MELPGVYQSSDQPTASGNEREGDSDWVKSCKTIEIWGTKHKTRPKKTR